MTVPENAILKKKLKTKRSYVNSVNDKDEVGAKKKLICRLRITSKNHPVITENDNSLQEGNDICSLPGSDIQKASLGRKRILSADTEKYLCKYGSLGTLELPVYKDSGCVYRDHRLGKVKSSVHPRKEGHREVKSSESLDASKKRQCAGVLRKLMSHKFGWVFNQPVDPVKLNIPDYFSVITKPMDLGTIMQKLEGKRYTKASQFADDVRLTFSNALEYNPPSNEVHIMAKILSDIFNSSWKVLEAKWNAEVPTLQDNIDEQTSKLGSSHPKHTSFSDSHSKKLSVPAENQCKNDAKRQRTGIQLHTGHAGKSGNENCEPCIPAQPAIYKSGDGGLLVEGSASKSSSENCEPCIATPPATSKSRDVGLFSEEISPSRALRAAMLKSRFADTIFKAEQKKLINFGKKEDLENMKIERRRLEDMQQKERLRIEAEMKALEEATRAKEAKLKMQREKEREAARLALQQMEKTVDIDENYELLKDLESFGYMQPSDVACDQMLDSMQGYVSPGSLGNPLERLGLFMKDNYLDEDLEEDGIAPAVAPADVEDGEIVSLPKF